MLPPFFAEVEEVVTEVVREGALSELLYADDLVRMSETIEGPSNTCLKWKEDFESKGLRANLIKTKVMLCRGITKDGMPKSKVDPCGACSLREKANMALCVQHGKWMYGGCAGVNGLTLKSSRNFACRKCEGNI